MTEKSDQKQKVPNEELIREVANIVFANVKIHLDDRLRQLDRPLEDLAFVKFNITALSTILAHKNLFTKIEFKKCYKSMVKSFGVVNPDGSMDGDVIITDYNLSPSGGE